MRILIDGYNLMHAAGIPPRRLGPDGLRKVRQRFLNELADLLGPVDAHQTTVVFDAATSPHHMPKQTRQHGLTIVFAVDSENADARLEEMIAAHSAPKRLRVVSSDIRVKTAASRRKATVETADAFWSRLRDQRDARGRRRDEGPSPAEQEEKDRRAPDNAEAAAWLKVFGEVDRDPETHQALNNTGDFIPTAEEIERIAREVDDEAW